MRREYRAAEAVGKWFQPARIAAHPLARNVTPYDVELDPGDMLFIPIGWWHQVRALNFSVMLTCTNFLWPNLGHETFPQD